jgi:hypothetical protein
MRCHVPQHFWCLEFTSPKTYESGKSACEALSGQWSAAPCPKERSLGSCYWSAENPRADCQIQKCPRRKFYYAEGENRAAFAERSRGADEARHTCSNLAGTWTPPGP